jgi:hypothetical protein
LFCFTTQKKAKNEKNAFFVQPGAFLAHQIVVFCKRKEAAMKGLETKCSRIWCFFVAVVFFCMPVGSFAQGNFSASELDTLVANIALYPDPLLVQVLAASTYGEQIAPAAAWAEAHKNLTGDALSDAIVRANLPYDASVQALIPFPRVLSMMDRYAAWTDQLGDAVYMQKEDVMRAVQRLRRAANEHGHLVSDERVKVTTGDNITILPVRTEYIYVPVYNPYVVYYRYYDGYVRVGYAPGVWLGTHYGYWGWDACWFDWNVRAIYVRDHRWHAPRRGPRHPHRYAPPPRRGHTVGPDLNRRHSAGPAPQTTRPAAAVSRHSATRPVDLNARETPSAHGYAASDAPRRNMQAAPPPSRAQTPREDRWENNRNSNYDPMDIANNRRQSSGSSSAPPPPPPSTRRDDQDRDDRGSSRGGFGGAIRRR